MIDFSITIPVRNREAAIRDCVASCYAQKFDPTRYEVIVVDNGSTDDTARVASRGGARVVSEPTPNRCLARNMGARVARGRWIVCTDSDCVADPGWLAALSEAEEKLRATGELETTAAIAGRIDSAPATTAAEAYIAARGWLDQEKFLSPGRKFSPPFAATANLAIRREAWERVGEFDPALSTAGEDADWCWRAQWDALKLHYAPAACVTHHHRATVKEMLQQAYNYGIGNADLFAKHCERFNATEWIDRSFKIWSAKAFLKSPFGFCFSSGYARRFNWYDALSNYYQSKGRKAGGKKHGLRIC